MPVARILTAVLRPFCRTQGARRAVDALNGELRNQRRHGGGLRRAKAFRRQRDLKLHVGCGPNARDGWVNIDLSSNAADCRLDLREDLPFCDASASIITSEHFFEHLAFPDDARHFLAESFRVLAPGGIFHVGVPDTQWPLEAYANGEDDYFALAKGRWAHPDYCTTRLDHINFHFRQGTEHLWAYDFESLRTELERVGFVDVTRRDFHPEYDTKERAEGTLYVQGVKP